MLLLLLHTTFRRSVFPTRSFSRVLTTKAPPRVGIKQKQRYLNTMPDAFEKMEEEGVSKASAPTKVATEEKDKVWPKLSPQEFKVYNQMAEHMDMFVRILPRNSHVSTKDY